MANYTITHLKGFVTNFKRYKIEQAVIFGAVLKCGTLELISNFDLPASKRLLGSATKKVEELVKLENSYVT